jgi:hypothetical protein
LGWGIDNSIKKAYVMKNTLLSVCVLLSLSLPSFAQQSNEQESKATAGSIEYQCNIVGISPGEPHAPLYNGVAYTAHVTVQAGYAGQCSGTVKIYLDDTLIGSCAVNGGSYVDISFPLRTFSVVTARYSLKLLFESTMGGYGSDITYVTVKDTHEAADDSLTWDPNSSLQQSNTNAPTVMVSVSGAEKNVQIQGLDPKDNNYQLFVTDLRGQRITVTDAVKDNSTLAIPTYHFPGGIYIINLKTADKNVRMKVQVIK